MKKCILLYALFSTVFKLYSQQINYSHLDVSSDELKTILNESNNFFSNMPHELPYFQGKEDNKYIKFYSSIGIVVNIDFKSEKEYLYLINQIQQNSVFNFKSCTEYSQNISYSYLTSSGNNIIFNFNEMRVSIKYPSSLDEIFDRNFEVLKQVFVCVSNDAYAFHTNLKCTGLANCEAKAVKTTIQDAKNHNYKFCKICISDEKSKSTLSQILNNDKTRADLETDTNSNDSDNENSDYGYDFENYEYDYELDVGLYREINGIPDNTKVIVQKAEKMFAQHLPKILKSKGEGAFIDLQRTHIGDFNNDGLNDVIIWINYSFGGNSIAGYEAAFYINTGDDAKVVAGFQPNYIFTIDEINNSIIYINKSEYADDDPRCCPSINTPIKLKYYDYKIFEVD